MLQSELLPDVLLEVLLEDDDEADESLDEAGFSLLSDLCVRDCWPEGERWSVA
jgi:hypothetical protein